MLSRLACVVCAVLLVASPSAAFAQSQWGLSTGFLLGTFDSDDVEALDKFLEQVTGYEAKFEGKSWDICAARGRAFGGSTRICYTRIKLDDGSGLRDEDGFEEGVTEDGAVKGFKVDRLFRIGPSSWPVAPAVTLHGGLGKVSGDAVFTVYNGFFTPGGTFVRTGIQAQERRKLSEYYGLIGEDWTVIGGGSIGLTAAFGDRFSVNLGIWGVELPGAYRGQLQLMYWP